MTISADALRHYLAEVAARLDDDEARFQRVELMSPEECAHAAEFLEDVANRYLDLSDRAASRARVGWWRSVRTRGWSGRR